MSSGLCDTIAEEGRRLKSEREMHETDAPESIKHLEEQSGANLTRQKGGEKSGAACVLSWQQSVSVRVELLPVFSLKKY